MVQHRGRHAPQAAAAAPSRNRTPRYARGSLRPVRRGARRTGALRGALHRHPRQGARNLPHLASHTAGARHRPRKGARHPGTHLLQERERLTGRITQAQHRRTAGLLQQPAGHPPPYDRDRGRTVGIGHRIRRPTFRDRRTGLHGPRELRPETLPAADDEDVGCRMPGLAHDADPLGA